jgi:Protein of unknown function (DUF4242)
MATVIVETVAEVPLRPLEPTETDYRVMDCLGQVNATWLYSLLSADSLRMVCRFEAPDAESVRQAYRRAGGFFSRVWTAQLIEPEGTEPQGNPALLTVFEGTYPNGFTDVDWEQASHQILPCYAERGVEWVRSFVSGDRTRMVCELNAPDAEVIRDAHRRFGIPFDRVWSATLLTPAAMVAPPQG